MDKFTNMLYEKVINAKNVPLTQPVYQTTLFELESYHNGTEEERSIGPISYYTRMGNPTVQYLANQLCQLTGFKKALIFPSGMSAITTSIFSLCNNRSRIAVSSRLYIDSLRFFINELPKFGVKIFLFDVLDLETLKKALDQNCNIVFFETLSNPDLTLADIDSIHSLLSKYQAISICDATFTPPGMIDSIHLKVDICLHSLTKYIGGHFTASGGAILSTKKIIEKIWEKQVIYGSCIDPHAAWLISQGVQSLELRIKKQSTNALIIANFLNSHEKIINVAYPKLDSYQQKNLYQKILKNGGGVISFSLKDKNSVINFLNNIKLIKFSVSLGGIRTCVGHSHSMRNSKILWDNLNNKELFFDVTNDLVRLSVGIENIKYIIKDLENALREV